MRLTSPVGHTSLRRTATKATGLSAMSSSSTFGWPAMSMSGFLRIHDVDAEGGVAGDAGRLALEPEIPPSERLLEKADARLGHCEMGIFVHPRADDRLARRAQAPHQPWHRIGIGVIPAA